MKVIISIDHLVSHGANIVPFREAAQFMQALPKDHRDNVAGFLENPVRMLA